MEREKPVSRVEFEDFTKSVRDALHDLKRLLEEPREVGVRHYRCGEKGCGYTTSDLASFIEHTVDERLKSLSSASPAEGEFGLSEEPKRRHQSTAEFLDCPECAPKFERVLADMGWEKPEPKRDSGLNI